MGLIRLLVFAALAYLVWRVAKHLLTQRGKGGGSRAGELPSQRMVQCRQCGVHVPDQDAFQHRGLNFCSQRHQSQYLEHHGP